MDARAANDRIAEKAHRLQFLSRVRRGGAKVFASGTLNFTSCLRYWPFQQMLENLWQRLATP